LRTVFDLDQKESRIFELNEDTQNPNFWDNQKRAVSVSQELSDLKEEVERVKSLRKDFEELKTLSSLSKNDEDLEKEVEENFKKLERRVNKEEITVFLSGKYDKNSAIITIAAGAGGQEAEDWATMLLRMYERYAERKEFKFSILDESFGEGGGPQGRIGIKDVTFEVKGKYAYGYLKKENGAHRLVRQSPFSSQSLRHTSFASVEVVPEISEEQTKEVEINPEDMRVDTYRSSGPGGQNVNKRETAIRITHIPSGVVVTCQSERSQAMNKEKAMQNLKSKLYLLEEQKRDSELKVIKGGTVNAEFGNQIRSYILHPYRLVKDLRTGVETSDPESVLEGELDEFIEAEIKIK
jgi:peptide chain release factor 2